MKNSTVRVFILALLPVMIAVNACAQASPPDSTYSLQTLKIAKLNYARQIGNQSRLLNGILYVEYKPGYVGNAYFLSASFQNAYLRYDDADFYNVPIVFDLYKNVVVINHPGDGRLMSLLNSKLDKLIIANHTFIRIDADSTQKLKKGFFELLYDGRTRLLAKHTKNIQEEKSGLTIQNIFEEKTDYSLWKGNVYYSVSGKGSMLNILKDKRKDLENYIKLNKIDFSENLEQALVTVVARYD